MSKLKQLMLSFAIAALATSISAAETNYPLVTFKCNADDDTVTLTNAILSDKEGPNFKYSDETGTYSPWHLVTIDRSTSRPRIVNTTKITKQCTLSSGEYTITLEPKIFNRSLNGTCGNSISSYFTVSHDDYVIRGRTPFESYCRGNAPVITRVVVFGKTSEVKVKRVPRYKFY